MVQCMLNVQKLRKLSSNYKYIIPEISTHKGVNSYTINIAHTIRVCHVVR